MAVKKVVKTETKAETKTAETKTAETKTAETKTAEKTYSASEVKDLITKAVAEAMANQPQAVLTTTNEYVTLVYLDAIADGMVVALGKLGNFNRAGAPRDVPKNVFIESLGIPVVDGLLRERKLIVLDGLTSEERERFELDYPEEEILSQSQFFKILNYSEAEICELFDILCESHKRIVAKIYLEAYFTRNDKRVNMSTVRKLNDMSKKVEAKGLFTPILEDMAEKITN